MIKVLYLSYRGPHIGHVIWLKALKILGHDVEIVSLRRSPISLIKKADILITEGVRSTACGIVAQILYKCWVAVACSPAVLNPVINRLYSMPDLVIAVSSLIKELINNKSVVLYPKPPELEVLLRLNVNYEKRDSRICYSGAFIPIKGLHMIPEIAAKLREEGIEAQFVLIGNTRENMVSLLIQKKALKYGVESYIRVISFLPRDQVFKLLSKCSIYLQPSLFDAAPISVIEAMALGVVPVITKYVGFRDLVKLISPTLIRDPNPNSIAETLMELLTNEKLLKEYSVLSRVVVNDILSLKSILYKVGQLVEECGEVNVDKRDYYIKGDRVMNAMRHLVDNYEDFR